MSNRERDTRIADLDLAVLDFENGSPKRAFKRLAWQLRKLIEDVAELQSVAGETMEK